MAKKKEDNVVKMEAKVDQSVRLGDVIDPLFQNALGILMGKTLPAQTAFKLLQIAKTVGEHQETFDKVRLGLITKYAEKDAEGIPKTNETKTQYLLKDKEGFDKEYNQLLTTKVEIQKIPLSCIEKVDLSAMLLQSLVKTVVNPDL